MENTMPFDSGNITFTACRLNKKLPANVVDDFIRCKAKSTDSVKDEPQIGWVTSRHLLDTRIDEDSAYTAGYLNLTLRSAVRKIPASLLKAECRIEELAMQQANDTQELTRRMKKEIKEDITERLLGHMPPSLSGTSFVAMQDGMTVYVDSASTGQIEQFQEEFKKTLDIDPYALTPEVICSEDFDVDPEKLPRLNFSRKLNDEYGCTGTIGMDFLTWLLYLSESEGGLIQTNEALGGEFGIALDGPLLFVADGKGALESVIRKGVPTQSAEAQAALDVGKKLKQAKILLARGEDVWQLTLDAETFAIRSMKLPQGEKLDKESEFQERMINIGIIRDTLHLLFQRFVETLQSPEKTNKLKSKIKSWLEERSFQFGDQ